jgi:hypothetical protein
MAVESIGNLIPTKIPGYTDAADIQAALRAYHYGSYTFDVNETNKANLISPSIAKTISDIQDSITAVDITAAVRKVDFDAKGDLIVATADNTPTRLPVGASNGLVLKVNSAQATGLEWVSESVTLTNSVTLSNKTLKSPREITTVSATASAGTINFDVNTQGVLYYTTNASANWTLNVRGDVSTTLNSLMATGDSLSIVFLSTQGTTAYYPTSFTIDGSSVTPKYQGGTAFSAGNVSSIDAYSYSIVKTGSAAYTVLASQTKFA